MKGHCTENKKPHEKMPRCHGHLKPMEKNNCTHEFDPAEAANGSRLFPKNSAIWMQRNKATPKIKPKFRWVQMHTQKKNWVKF